MAEIGTTLEITEAAAKMRISRALDKLRKQLAGQGILASAAALVIALEQSAHAALPDGILTNVLKVIGNVVPLELSVPQWGFLAFTRTLSRPRTLMRVLGTAWVGLVALVATLIIHTRQNLISVAPEPGRGTAAVAIANQDISSELAPKTIDSVADPMRLTVLDQESGTPRDSAWFDGGGREITTAVDGGFSWDQYPPEGLAAAVVKVGFVPEVVMLSSDETET